MQNEESKNISQKSKYFLYIAILFVAILMISNTVAVKIIQISTFVFSGATFIFPISYIFGDILTEVYGYKATRKIIWIGFVTQILMVLCYLFVQILPSAPFWNLQDAYVAILGAVPRIVFASVIAYFVGEFANSYVLSKMKIFTNGKHLWTRTIGSTAVGQLIDSALFASIAFFGVIPNTALISMILSLYVIKVIVEVVLTPFTYYIVNKLKKAEGIDTYDHGINYNPFKLKE